jgi:CTD small phosphatase-like protein 2
LLKLCNSLHKPKDKADTLQAKQVKFGENEGKLKTLVLDMDETMLHAKFIADQSELANDDGNFVFTLQSEESGSKDIGGRPSESMQISVKMRPYLDMALDFLSKYYEICVFTAGTQDYADACLDFLDPERKVIRHRLYRQHCVNPCSGVYVKDLRIISDRNLKDIIIVDNSIISFAY